MQSFLTLESQKQLSEIVLQLSQQPLILQLSQQDLLYKQPAAQAKKTKTVIIMPETTTTIVKSVSTTSLSFSWTYIIVVQSTWAYWSVHLLSSANDLAVSTLASITSRWSPRDSTKPGTMISQTRWVKQHYVKITFHFLFSYSSPSQRPWQRRLHQTAILPQHPMMK